MLPDLWRAKPESLVPMHLKELLNEVALVAVAFLGRGRGRGACLLARFRFALDHYLKELLPLHHHRSS